MRSASLYTRSIALVAVLTVGVSCGGSSDDTGTGPTSTTGSFTASLSGTSYTGNSTATGANGTFLIAMRTESGSFALNFTWSGGRPNTGAYQVAINPSTTVFGGGVVLNNGQAAYGFSGGTLTISSSSSSQLTGTFNVNLTPLTGGSSVSTTGSFTAVCPLAC